MFNICLRDFFNRYDTSGNYHNGFLQSINLNSYVDITLLNEITMNLMDAFILNEIGNIKTMGRWNCFLSWDKDEKKYKINADFYESAKNAIYVYLVRSQRFFELINTNFSSLSATETKTIVYGAKEEQRDYDKVIVNIERENDTTNYGAETFTKQFGELETETIYGQGLRTLVYGAQEKETEYGNTQRTLQFGATSKTNEYGATSETDTIGSQTNSSGTTNQTHPFDMNAFLDDTASSTSTTNGQRQDTKTTLLHTDNETTTQHSDTDTSATHTDTETTTAYTDTDTTASRTDTETTGTHTDTETTATHTDTNTYGDITNTTDERTDTTTIKTHTDTETRTKVILISPDKYFEIMKELYSYNVYDILLNAVKDTFSIREF